MKILRKLAIILGLVLVLSSCGGGADSDQPTETDTSSQDEVEVVEEDKETSEPATFKPITITDAEGREIEFDKEAQRVICIGPGALRLYTYINGSDRLVGVEDIDKADNPKKPYLLAYPEIRDLDTIGPGGPKNAPDAELLAFAQADVIFASYGLGAEDLDKLQEQTASKVVALSYGKDSVFDPKTYESLENIGKVTNNEARAKEVIDYMDQIHSDLNSRTQDLDSGPGVYIGGVGFREAQGILSSRSDFAFFNNVNANNVLDEITNERNVMLDKEKLLELDPEIIFLDLDGQELIEEDMKQDPDFYSKLSAFKNSTAYGIMPYNNYITNIDTAMADMYYIGSVVHPQAFEDTSVEEKSREIYSFLLGTDLYDQMIGLYPDSFKVFEIVQ